MLDGVRRVGWGEVTSYGRLARSIGRPGAARAAGGAVGPEPGRAHRPVPSGHRRRRVAGRLRRGLGWRARAPPRDQADPARDRGRRRSRSSSPRPEASSRDHPVSGSPARSLSPGRRRGVDPTDCDGRRTAAIVPVIDPPRSSSDRENDMTAKDEKPEPRTDPTGPADDDDADDDDTMGHSTPDLRLHPPARPGARPRGDRLGEPRGHPQAVEEPDRPGSRGR